MTVEFTFTDEEKATYREFRGRVNVVTGQVELLGSRTTGEAARFEFIRAIPITSKVDA